MDPKHSVAVDYETEYFEDKEGGGLSIRTMGARRYVTDKDFFAYLVSFKSHDIAYSGPVETAPWDKIAGRHWISHNAYFDQLVFLSTVARKITAAKFGPAQWDCTLSLAAWHRCEWKALDKVMKYFYEKEVSKDPRAKMKNKHWSDLKPEDRQEIIDYAQDDADNCYQFWCDHSQGWPDQERELARLTNYWAWDGICIDQDVLKKGIDHFNQQCDDARKLIPWAKDKKPLSPKALAAHCASLGIPAPTSTAMDNPAAEKWIAKYGEEHQFVLGIKNLRRANKHLKTLEALQRRMMPDGMFPYEMKYFGTHTGRWSGAGGVNVQNPPIKDKVVQELGFDFRYLFVPKPGKKYIICDLSQIEPRILAWWVNDQALLGLVRQGMNIYEAFARLHFGYKDPGKLKEKNPLMYAQAKANVLGLGYGMGADRFQAEAEEKYGLVLSKIEAKETVDHFRNSNPRIRALWNAYDKEFKQAQGGTYEIELLTGRSLKFYDVTFTRGRGWVCKQEFGAQRYVNMWGGVMTENVIQATARDVFAEHLIAIHKSGIGRIVWHVHDEVILECDPDVDPRDVEQLMSVTPEWIPELPIEAEASEATFYEK